MKSKFFIPLIILLIGLIYLYIQETSFSPLKEKDFKKLFSSYKDIEKDCNLDFLGLNFKGEFFEFYMYTIGESIVDDNYPIWDGTWEDKKISEGEIASQWRNCPIDSAAFDLYKFLLTVENFNKHDCSSLFNNELEKPENYYAYVYFNEMEQYFLLYSPKNKRLYYLRKKGF